MRPLRLIFPFLLLGAIIIGAFRLRIDTDVLNVLPASNDAARGLAEYQKHFLNADEALVVVRSGSAETTTQAAQAIVAAATNAPALIARAYWQPPANDSIASIAQYLAFLWINGATNDALALRESIAPAQLPQTIESAKQRIATSMNPADLMILPRDPLGLSRAAGASEQMQSSDQFFASADGLTRIVYLYAAQPLRNYEACRQWVSQVRATIRGVTGKLDGTSFSLTGRPVFVDEISSGMKNDLSTAVPGTLLTIAVLFYLLHREVKSMLLLLGTLLFVLVCTALTGAAFLGQLNVLSIGFASILLGLAEDFGIVLHHEAKLHPGATAEEIRKSAAKGIVGSSATTAAAFGLLNLSSLPGLKALGTLVALGILLGAWAMLYIFLPLIVRWKKSPRTSTHPQIARKAIPVRFARGISAVLLAFGVLVLFLKPPAFDPSPDVFRPKISEASDTIKVVQEIIGATDPYWLLLQGDSVPQVRAILESMEARLASNSQGLGIQEYTLPLSVWPNLGHQKVNLPILQSIASQAGELERSILAAQFTDEALLLAREVFREWRNASAEAAIWPRGSLAEWVVPKLAVQNGPPFLALGILRPAANFTANGLVPVDLKRHVTLTGWPLLGKSVLENVRTEIPLILALVAVTVIAALWLTFRSMRHVLACLATLAFSGLVLQAVMSLAGWRWNLINLTSLPLLLGMGIDYSIHMLTSQDQSQKGALAFSSVGPALLLAGSTSIAGFFFLALSFNSGMASLGAVCALGLAILLLTSVFLLPAWAVNLGRNRVKTV